MALESLRLVTPELAERLGLPAAKGAASGGLTWLVILMAAALVVGVIGLVALRRRLRARGERGLGLTAFVVVGPLALGAALGAWVGFGHGAARGASQAVEEALAAIGEREMAGVLTRAERLAIEAGVSTEMLDADVVARVIDPYLARLSEAERALSRASLSDRLPLMIERAALEAAVTWVKGELGARPSWRTLSERAGALAVERLRAASHALLSPVRNAGLPFVLVWAALVLGAHGYALHRAGARRPEPTSLTA